VQPAGGDRHGIAVLAVADQPHEVLGSLAVGPAAGERAHAVERERRRVAVAHRGADVAERDVGEADRQGEHLDPALVGSAAQRAIRPGGAGRGVGVRAAGDHALERGGAEQAASEGRTAPEERPSVESGMHP
jgi:hypothetical protein